MFVSLIFAKNVCYKESNKPSVSAVNEQNNVQSFLLLACTDNIYFHWPFSFFFKITFVWRIICLRRNQRSLSSWSTFVFMAFFQISFQSRLYWLILSFLGHTFSAAGGMIFFPDHALINLFYWNIGLWKPFLDRVTLWIALLLLTWLAGPFLVSVRKTLLMCFLNPP